MSEHPVLDWVTMMGRSLNDWLHTVPTTQFKILVGAALAFLTFALYAVLAVANRTIDAIAFGLWLGFVAAWAALAYRQFKAKRETDYGYMERKSQAIPKPPEAQ